jgi:hypothetical protein
MKFWIKILMTMLGVYVAGLVTGYFISPSYQNQAKIIGQTATVIQYPAIIGVALAAWKLISDWHRENVLEYGGLFVKQLHYRLGGQDIYRPAYHLRVKRIRGRGRGENCDGLLTVEGTDVNRNTVWDGDIPYIPISNQGDLKIFEIHENEFTHKRALLFRSNPTNSEKTVLQDDIPYTEELAKRKVTIRLGSSNAKVPSKPFIRTVGEIIESALQE